MRGDKKGIRKAIGHFYRIPLGNGEYAYGQVVTKVDHVFFDYKDKGKPVTYEEILSSKVIFRCTVDRYVLAQGYWEIIGKFPVNPEYQEYKELFSYNPFKKCYQIFKDGIGFVPATWEEIKDMEPFSSWTHTGLEQRLRDHFAGRPSYAVESSRYDHDPTFPKKEAFYKQYGCVLVDKENWVYAPPGTKVKYD